MLNKSDREVLRNLARKYAERAALPEQEEKRSLWESLNTFRMQRPMALFDQLPWHELDVDGSLVCQVQDPWWRGVECQLRRELYKWDHMRADMVLPPYIVLPGFVGYTNFGLESCVHRLALDPLNSVRAQAYDCQFNSMDDVEKIKTPEVRFDREGQARAAAEADELFDGIVGWRFAGITMHLGVWDWISQYMGVTNVYMALYDKPEMLHAMMERFTQGILHVIGELDMVQGFDLYSTYCHCSHTFLPDDLRGTNVSAKGLPGGTAAQSWAFGLAQLFTSVSPDVTEEFEVAYMKRIFPRFGNIYYGCCDRLDDRMETILELPRVRKISCSPWSDAEAFAAQLPRDRIMSIKPSPAFFAGPDFDLDATVANVRDKLAAARRHGCNCEFIFKDVSTVNYEPQRLWQTAEAVARLLEDGI